MYDKEKFPDVKRYMENFSHFILVRFIVVLLEEEKINQSSVSFFVHESSQSDFMDKAGG